MTVFDAFPNGIEEWGLAIAHYSTLTGNTYELGDSAIKLHVIIDEAQSTDPNPAPNAQGIEADTLVYCIPDELPTLDTAALCAGYVCGPWTGEKVYSIIDAAIGKNQETGIIEHVELRVRQTTAEGVSNGA